MRTNNRSAFSFKISKISVKTDEIAQLNSRSIIWKLQLMLMTFLWMERNGNPIKYIDSTHHFYWKDNRKVHTSNIEKVPLAISVNIFLSWVPLFWTKANSIRERFENSVTSVFCPCFDRWTLLVSLPCHTLNAK